MTWRNSPSVGIAVACLFASAVVALAQGVGPVAGPGGPGTYGPPMATSNGHVQFGNGLPPALSACGTNPTSPAGTDAAFNFVTGTSASGVCTVKPAVNYALRPTCSVDSESATPPAFNVTASGQINFTSGIQDSTRYNVICFAQPGGM